MQNLSNVLAVGLFWRNDLGCASVVPSEQTSSSYIILDLRPGSAIPSARVTRQVAIRKFL